MANYLSLEEAAKKLGISTDKLVDLRSQGQVRGFRDGASWKFPEDAIEQLADDLAAEGGSGDLVTDANSGGSNPSDSDVNLIPSEGEGSDVAIVTSDSELLMDSEGDSLFEIDSGDLQLEQAAIGHDSGQLDLSVEPNTGSTGPVTDEELDEIAQSHPEVMGSDADDPSSGKLDLGSESGDEGSDLGFSGLGDEDSGDAMLGDEDSAMDVLGGESTGAGAGASNLELMDELEESKGDRGDVLSELDLLSAEQKGSGLVSGDSENLLASSGLGSSIGADSLKDSDLGALDDALADDDELIIADDDDDLVISSAGSDISVAGDSGINLMSPSDSGLSLESEPLDLAGSSISALDLGAELADAGSGSGGSGPGSDGSLVDFQADEEFQLSPSGVGIDADIESGSQVIEVEDSEAMAEPVEFAEDPGDALGGDVFAADGEEALGLDEEGEAVAIDESAAAPSGSRAVASYEVPFSLLQCVTLMMILMVMSLGGMLMTDLVRNMWAYSETSAPVSALTDSLIAVMGW